MKLFFALIVLMLSGSAFAQAPEILQTESRVDIGGVGESKTFRFDQPFKSFDSAPKGVINFLPQTDRQLTVTGLEAGQTLMFIFDDQDRVIYTATVTVALSSGHLVKIYGHRSRDFRGYYCNDVGCGRADLDKKLANGGRDPDEPNAISVTQPTGGGGYTTRQYGPN